MLRLCVAALFAAAAFADSSAPQFAIADIHPSPHDTQPFARGPFYADKRYELRFATMLDLIHTAYNVDPEKVVGGPSWLEMDRFDVFAMTPENANAETRRLMLQSLLADRFGLVVRNDTKPMPAFALKAARKPSLKEASEEGESGCNFTVQNTPAPNAGAPGSGPIQLPVINYTCKKMSMEKFA